MYKGNKRPTEEELRRINSISAVEKFKERLRKAELNEKYNVISYEDGIVRVIAEKGISIGTLNGIRQKYSNRTGLVVDKNYAKKRFI